MFKKISAILLSSVMVVACTTPLPPKPHHSPTIMGADHPTTAPLATSLPIVELPQTSSQPLKEVNHVGQVPTVSELTDNTLNDLNALAENAPIQFDFEQVSLRQLIEIIGDTLKLNMVIDPSIGDKVTLRTAKDKPLRKPDLWPLLQLLLNDASISVEKKGGIYYFKKTGPVIPGDIGTSTSSLSRSEAPEVLQITPLRYISAESATAVLAPMVQPRGRILNLPNLNVIGIITTPQRLERVNKLLNILDADPFLHRGLRLFRLKNSKATEVQAELDKILQAISGKTPPAYQTIGLERTNAILVIAPPGGGFDEIATWVDVLDEKSDDSQEQVFIYHVKNLEAAKLATTLTEVFRQEGEQDKKDKSREETPPKTPFPRRERPEEEENPEQPPPKTPQPPARPVSGVLAVSAQLKVNLVADESTNSLLIKATPRDYRQLLETIYALDKVPKEVMINIVIAEVTLNETTKFGIDWQTLFESALGNGRGRTYVSTNFGISGGAVFNNSSSTTASSGQTTTTDNKKSPTALSGFVIDYVSGNLSAILNLLATTNDISILSRPSLLVRNNEEASMNVGTNEPILGSINRNTSVNDSMVYQDVQYKDTGITVKVTPRINDDGIINMKIEQELSQARPQQSGALNTPAFDQRKVATSVVIRDGNAIVIGGLIETINKNNQQGIPGLKDVPLIGNILFSSSGKDEKRTELVLIIVPQVVSPELNNRPLLQEFGRRMVVIKELLDEEGVILDGFNPPPTKK